MSELRARCQDWLAQEGFYESTSSNFNPTVQVADSLQGLADALVAFAKAEQIKGMEACKKKLHFIMIHHVPVERESYEMMKWLDATIAQLKEGG